MKYKASSIAAAMLAGFAAYCYGHIGYCYPAGAQRGTVVDVLIGGQGIGGKNMIEAGPGITVEKVNYINGLSVASGPQRRYLIEWMNALERYPVLAFFGDLRLAG